MFSCNSGEQQKESPVVASNKHTDFIPEDSACIGIIDASILSPERLVLTREYVRAHYGLRSVKMLPRGIIIHYTALPDLRQSLDVFEPDTISSRRSYVRQFGLLNVGAHYLVDTNGQVYQLLPDDFIGRHTIGFNSSCIGIENVSLTEDELTDKQVEANCMIVSCLRKKHPEIKYLFGHHEYMLDSLPHFSLFNELDTTYHPTHKVDPGASFMSELRSCLESKGVYLQP